MRFIQKIREAGLKGLIVYLRKFALKKFYHLIATVYRYPRYQNPTLSELQHIESTLISNGITPVDYRVDLNGFNAFQSEYQFGDRFYGGTGFIFIEKVLEHYLAFDLGLRSMPQGGYYIDVAAANSPWVKMLRDNGYKADAIDLEPSKHYSSLPYYHVMDATQTCYDPQSIDFVSLQCAFEMFIHDDDMKLIHELSRILKPGGSALICPLYMHIEYCGYCSPEYWYRKDFHDSNAELYVSPNSYGIPFSRKYDVAKLQQRVLETITQNDMNYKIRILRNGADIDPQVYCYFILEIQKKGDSK